MRLQALLVVSTKDDPTSMIGFGSLFVFMIHGCQSTLDGNMMIKSNTTTAYQEIRFLPISHESKKM